MAVKSGRITVGTTATDLGVTCVMPWRVLIKNDDNTDAVFIGNGDVTAANGLRLAKEATVELRLAPLDRVFAVSTKQGHTISFIRFTQAC